MIKRIDDILEHIHAVEKNCIKLGKIFIEQGHTELGRDLIRNGRTHDLSKLEANNKMNYFNEQDKESITTWFLKYNGKSKAEVEAIETAKIHIAVLKSFHTKQLLQMRYGGGHDFTIDEIRSELEKRPHIPNKKEGKLLRQQLAKKFKGTRNKNR